MGGDVKGAGRTRGTSAKQTSLIQGEKSPEDVWECKQWIMGELTELGGNRNGQEVRGSRRKEEATQAKDQCGFSLLQNTNWEETTVVAQKLVESGHFKVTDADKQGNTILHHLAESDNEKQNKILDIFLNYKVIPLEDLQHCLKTKNEQGKTPLHIACGVGNLYSVKQLVKATKSFQLSPKKISLLSSSPLKVETLRW